MMKILRAGLPGIFVLVLSTLGFTYTSYASVLINDMTAARDEGAGLSSGFIGTGSGNGNFEIIICGIDAAAENPFSLPFPGSWDELNNSACQGPLCQLGIWAREVSSIQSEEINCSWLNGSSAFVAASIRYSNVDTEDPIIDMACSEFIDGNYVIDPVSSEPGAQLVNIQMLVTTGGVGEPFVDFSSTSGVANSAVEIGEGRLLGLGANSSLDPGGAGFEGVEFPPFTDVYNTRICVLTLRPAVRSIPTIGEWGLIAMAGILGMAAFMVLRRRQAAA